MTDAHPSVAITITLPVPHHHLSPNARVYWAHKASHTASYRHECMVLALQAKRESTQVFPLTPPVQAVITFILKDKRRHDWDNLLASIKAGIDGIVDAGLLPDDDVRSWSPTLRFEQGEKACVRIELMA